MRRGVAWWMGVLFLIPEIAQAGELTLGGEVRVGYDSNVFNRESDSSAGGRDPEVDSAVVNLRGMLGVEDELERGRYQVDYRPSFFYNEDSQADNFWNHRAVAEGSYYFSPRTQLTLVNDFARLEKIVFAPDVAQNPNVNDDTRKTIRNQVRLSGSHMLTQRLSVFAGSSHELFRYGRRTDQDSDYFSGNVGTQYAVSPQLSIGGGGNLSYRSFDRRSNSFSPSLEPPPPIPDPNNPDHLICGGRKRPGNRTLTYSGYASVSYQFDETTKLQFQGGPAQIENNQFICSNTAFANGVWQRQDSSQTTWFASGELSKSWKRVKSSLAYRRQEGLGENGTASVNDFVTLRFDWRPARLWTLNLTTSWTRRTQDSVQNAAGTKNKNDSTLYSVGGRVSRRFLQRLVGFVELSYRHQDQTLKGPPGFTFNDNDYDATRAFVGLRYELDPIRY